MGLIKKMDVPKYFAVCRAMRVNAIRQVMQPHATAIEGVEPVGTRGNAAMSIEDFPLQHSFSPAIVPPKA